MQKINIGYNCAPNTILLRLKNKKFRNNKLKILSKTKDIKISDLEKLIEEIKTRKPLKDHKLRIIKSEKLFITSDLLDSIKSGIILKDHTLRMLDTQIDNIFLGELYTGIVLRDASTRILNPKPEIIPSIHELLMGEISSSFKPK